MKGTQIILLILGFTAISSHAASFDCRQATSKIDVTICNSSEMSQLDEKLAKIFSEMKSNYPNYIAENFVLSQGEWTKFRNNSCNTAEISCISYHYEDRIKMLQGDWWGDISGIALNGDDPVIKITKDLAIFADSTGKSYRPYFVYPNTKVSILRQLMNQPFQLGSHPYNTYEHAFELEKEGSTRKVVSC